MKLIFWLQPCHALAAVILLLTTLVVVPSAGAMPGDSYAAWKHSAVLNLLTTDDGASLPSSAKVDNFPVLVRLNRDFFDFRQAQPHGQDIRFTSANDQELAFQIEQWDAAKAIASIWVRVPTIRGNARQAIRMYWGNADATSKSNGAAVFNAANGYASVWHMADPMCDEVGTLTSRDMGTTPAEGIIGQSRHLAGSQGVFCGDKIATYPSGDEAHSTEAWIRAERPNTTIIGWGNEGGGRGTKVRMQLRSPAHVHIDSDFADVGGASHLQMNRWIHVAYTYDGHIGRVYIDGQLDGEAKQELNIRSPSRMWIGGWYNHYDFVGDIDEVRVSHKARSAAWIKLEYENQKPMQTLIGPPVQPGNTFAVSPQQVSVAEGGRVTIHAQADGAQKIYWTLRSPDKSSVVAVDCLAFTFNAGRVRGDVALELEVRAIYPGGTRTQMVAIHVHEAIADPAVTLTAPAKWDGRRPLHLKPIVSNQREIETAGAGKVRWRWDVSGMAVIQHVDAGGLTLLRAMNSGKLTVSVTADNGGTPVEATANINVSEPANDAWAPRNPDPEEMPEQGEFYARDDKGSGTLWCTGKLNAAADSVYLKIFAGDRLQQRIDGKVGSDGRYAVSAKLKAKLVEYRIVFGAVNGGQETILHQAGDIVCGDAYLIDGQSNALATDTSEDSPPTTSEWIRSYGGPTGRADGTDWVRDRTLEAKRDGLTRPNLWDRPVWKSRRSEKVELGYWGMELAKQLVASRKIPIFIINAAVGGTRIDQHQPTPDNHSDLRTMYGRMLWRVRQARLSHGIRAVIWHQGENDQGAQGPTDGYGWQTYDSYFLNMSAAWKQDMPNIQHYYIFQIWPNACAMGGSNGSGDMIREMQRRLPQFYSNMSILATLGVRPSGGCHYPLAGWAQFARMLEPMIERDIYGRVFTQSISPPNVQEVRYTSAARDEIALRFDQPVAWRDSLISEFYLDGQAGKVKSGRVSGNVLTLKLRGTSTAKTITYLKELHWSQDNLLLGTNGMAALTFCAVPIAPQESAR